MSVSDMRRMTWWQFSEVVDGFVKSKSDGRDEGFSAIDERNMDGLLSAPI